MSDFHYEQILPVKQDTSSKILKVVIIVASILATIALNLMLGFIGAIASMILLILVFKLCLPRLNKEYEYALTNQFLQIATIYNKETRKENLTINIKEVDLIAPSDSSRMEYHSNVKKELFVSGNQAKTYSILVKTAKGVQNILIEPDDRLVELIKKQASINMYMN